MNQDLIADIWNVLSERITDKDKKDAAAEFINTLLDYGINESVIEGLFGIDTYLDGAIEYAIDDDGPSSSNDYFEEWDEE
jgi:hypothetical protein